MEDDEGPAAAAAVDLQDDSRSAAAAEAQLAAAAASQAQHLDCMMAGFQAFLQYQQIVGISATADGGGLLPAQQVKQQQQEQQQQQQQQQSQKNVLQQTGLAGASASIAVDSTSSSSVINSGDDGSSTNPASPIDLLHCAVLIARHAYPTADLVQIRAAVADLGARAAAVAAAASSGSSSSGSRVRTLAAAVSHVLYDVEGYQGAVDDYYSPDSQCINRLLETKQGARQQQQQHKLRQQ
jgi:hypothetical protein